MLNEHIFFNILKVVIIYNAVQNGWRIKRINNKSFILKKKKEDEDCFVLEEFINKIAPNETEINKLFENEIKKNSIDLK